MIYIIDNVYERNEKNEQDNSSGLDTEQSNPVVDKVKGLGHLKMNQLW